MNIIGIDPSISGTGMCINGKMFSFSYNHKAYTKSGNYTKWFELADHVVNFRFHDQVHKTKNYEDEQLFKLVSYTNVVDRIMEDIFTNIDPNKDTYIGIEGYSFASMAGNLIDLVTFSTLLRDRINQANFKLVVVSPLSLKKESCIMCYEPVKIEKGVRVKKIILEHRNNEGIAGGNFKKPEMMKACIENDNWKDDAWVKHLKSVNGDITGSKIPHPHEDLTDAYLLHRYIKERYLKI